MVLIDDPAFTTKARDLEVPIAQPNRENSVVSLCSHVSVPGTHLRRTSASVETMFGIIIHHAPFRS